jgi:dihydropyrimidinase
VRGGKVLIPGQGILELDLALEGGRVRALGRDLDPAGAQVIEAAGKLVIPGVIDPHVHLGIYGDFRGELETETRSALATGVTSFGLYAGGTEPYLKTLDATIGAIDSLSRADIFIHLPIFTREQLEEIPVYASRYGIMSFKVYMCGIPGIIPAADDAFLFDVMEEVARLGSEAVLCVHAENQSLVERAIALGLDREPGGLDPAAWNASRPSYVEEEAIRRVEFLARKAGVKVYIVHVSSADGVAAIRELKASGRRILAETTSPFLSLEPGSGRDSRTLMAPPVRGGADRAALWSGLRDGTLDSIGTDHTPLSSGQKRLGSRYPEALLGYPAIGTHLPSIIDACLGSGFPLELAVEKLTRRPAEIFGLYPRKGTLLPGSDADLAIIDLSKTEVVSPGRTASRADFSLHEGERLAGWPDLVVKGGIVQVQGSAPTGRYLRRGRSRRT